MLRWLGVVEIADHAVIIQYKTGNRGQSTLALTGIVQHAATFDLRAQNPNRQLMRDAQSIFSARCIARGKEGAQHAVDLLVIGLAPGRLPWVVQVLPRAGMAQNAAAKFELLPFKDIGGFD